MALQPLLSHSNPMPFAHVTRSGRLPGEPGPRSHVYDVYGQPRALAPVLPAAHRSDVAPLMLNTRHIGMEGEVGERERQLHGLRPTLQLVFQQPTQQRNTTVLTCSTWPLRTQVLRAPGSHTSSGCLLRAAGKTGRQFALAPGHLHFGTVARGTVAHATARLRNTSTGPARFQVRARGWWWRW